ncbi:MAG: UvrD-helicase domain-containing protein [Caldilinea sp.]
MPLIADLHIHSYYSRATSKDLTLEQLWKWAQLKGIGVVATGDIAHPGWLAEIQQKLIPAEPGLFCLRAEFAAAVADQVPPACRGEVRFLLGGEISNIYKRHGKTRKVHNLLFAPDLDAVGRLQTRLERIGNIRSDGRPILGLDSRDLLETALEVDERCHLIPAHIWTPWFALLGSMSGFDSVEACFGDLTPYIFALETGLSSDPPMNWRVSSLDRYTLVSSSDAHSPQKLGREATLFSCALSYDALFAALHSGDPATFQGTVEFFPEEGKYHIDGHRGCGIRWEPAVTRAHAGRCPVCGKEVTVGVLHRVESLADRGDGASPPRPHPFARLVPLPELLGELFETGSASRRVQREYHHLLAALGPELAILRELPLDTLAAVGGPRLAQGIDRMRRGQVDAEAGYDGEYGVVRVFSRAALGTDDPQQGLFAPQPAQQSAPQSAQQPAQQPDSPPVPLRPASSSGEASLLAELNAEQQAAVLCTDVPLLIAAGPGTGKTRTLTLRVAHLVRALGVPPQQILAITFTNKAAQEMVERLDGLLGAVGVTVRTFHAFGASLLRQSAAELGLGADFVIVNEELQRQLLARLLPEAESSAIEKALRTIAAAKQQWGQPAGEEVPLFDAYNAALRQANAVDFDDLVSLAAQLLATSPAVAAALHARYRFISVDEYQDVNLAQVALLRGLAAGGANVCAIGDPDQAIYGFRGADRRFFLEFLQEYPTARCVRLAQNYRSLQGILDAAMQVIRHNPDPGRLPLQTQLPGAVKLELHAAPTDKAEAETIVHQIEQRVGGTSYFSLDSGRADGRVAALGFGDFAVLYRLSAQASALVEAFERSGIPYQVVGQEPLWSRDGVRLLLDALWLLESPRSLLHLEALLAAVVRVETATADAQLLAHSLLPTLPAALQQLAGRYPASQQRRLRKLADFWTELEATWATQSLAACIEALAAFLDLSETLSQQLAERALPFGRRCRDFLEMALLESAGDRFDLRADRVTLMTFHAAKGLEFPVVFLAGCEEGVAPYQRLDDPCDLEEERRIFYVAMTRARTQLILSHARRRFLYGRRQENLPSRFIGEIEAALLELHLRERAEGAEPPPAGIQLGLFGEKSGGADGQTTPQRSWKERKHAKF